MHRILSLCQTGAGSQFAGSQLPLDQQPRVEYLYAVPQPPPPTSEPPPGVDSPLLHRPPQPSSQPPTPQPSSGTYLEQQLPRTPSRRAISTSPRSNMIRCARQPTHGLSRKLGGSAIGYPAVPWPPCRTIGRPVIGRPGLPFTPPLSSANLSALVVAKHSPLHGFQTVVHAVLGCLPFS